jgi:hypothetical protein
MVLAEVVALPQQVQMELPALEQEPAVTAAQELHLLYLAPQQLMPVVEVVALVMMVLLLELVVLAVVETVAKGLSELLEPLTQVVAVVAVVALVLVLEQTAMVQQAAQAS